MTGAGYKISDLGGETGEGDGREPHALSVFLGADWEDIRRRVEGPGE